MGIIKNYNELAVTPERKTVLDLIEAGIRRVQPHKLMETAVRYNKTFNSVVVQNNSYDVISGRIFVIGGGKASGRMAEKFEEIVGAKNITAGIVNSIGDDYKTDKIKVIKASHPIPDKNGVQGVLKMLKLKGEYKINEKDLVICLISGGGSALMPAPAKGVKLEDKQATTQLLLECGADIREINMVRKHLSRIKGGQLGKHFAPAKVVSLIISDVIGNDLDVIASGATVNDPTTFNDANSVLIKYNISDKVPRSVKAHIEKGVRGEVSDTPKNITNCDNFIIGDVTTAMGTITIKAKGLGLKPLIATSGMSGETIEAATRAAKEIIMGEYDNYDLILFGGETTPRLPSDYGKGGRNQYYVGSSMLLLSNYNKNWTIAGIGTDGVDYIKGVAGAIADNQSFQRAKRLGIDVKDYIKRFDSNIFFEKLGNSLIKTDPTGTNVGDIVIYLLK